MEDPWQRIPELAGAGAGEGLVQAADTRVRKRARAGRRLPDPVKALLLTVAVLSLAFLPVLLLVGLLYIAEWGWWSV